MNHTDEWASPYDGPQSTGIQVLSPDGSFSTATVRWWVENGYELVLEHEGRQTHASALDYFEAFQQARRRFEADGFRFLCYGASRNAFASGMARDMGLGLNVYLITPGEAPERIVHIFDSGPDVIPATVDENWAFIQEWVRTDWG